MMEPSGLAAIGLAVVIPFIFWWMLLGDDFARVGFTPLAAGYACATLGLLVVAFTMAYSDLSNPAAMLGGTIYMATVFLVFVLPLLAIVGVPLAAVLLRMRKLTYASIAIAALTLWLAAAVLAWVYSINNEWHRTHLLESFTTLLMEFLPGIALIGVPFMLGIRAVSAGRPN